MKRGTEALRPYRCSHPKLHWEQMASRRYIEVGSANPAVRTRKHEVVSCSVTDDLFPIHLKIKSPPRSLG
jgi:hypothetical protein